MRLAIGVGTLVVALSLFSEGDTVSALNGMQEPVPAKSATDDVSLVVAANHRFASGIYTKISEDLPRDENIAFAPGTALPLAALSALPETEDGEQARTALKLTLDRSRLETALATLAQHRLANLNKPEEHYLGLQIEAAEKGGIKVKSVLPGSPAAQAGFQPGERLLSIRSDDGTGLELRSAAEFVQALDEAPEILRIRCRTVAGDETVTRRLNLGKKAVAAPGKREVQIRFAGNYWYDPGDPPLQSVREFARDSLGLPPIPADFAKDQKKLADWFSRRTTPEREVTFEDNAFPEKLRAAIGDSVQFRPVWSPALQPRPVIEMPFNIGKRRGRIPALPLSGRMKVGKDPAYLTVEVPCLGGLAMTFVMPLKAEDWPAVEKKIAAAEWDKLLTPGTLQDLTVVVPFFDFLRINDLRRPLSAIGLKKAFGEKNGPTTLLQQVHIGVGSASDEPGETELPKGVPVIELDRAFAFIVHDRRTNEIVVLGRLANPRSR